MIGGAKRTIGSSSPLFPFVYNYCQAVMGRDDPHSRSGADEREKGSRSCFPLRVDEYRVAASTENGWQILETRLGQKRTCRRRELPMGSPCCFIDWAVLLKGMAFRVAGSIAIMSWFVSRRTAERAWRNWRGARSAVQKRAIR